MDFDREPLVLTALRNRKPNHLTLTVGLDLSFDKEDLFMEFVRLMEMEWASTHSTSLGLMEPSGCFCCRSYPVEYCGTFFTTSSLIKDFMTDSGKIVDYNTAFNLRWTQLTENADKVDPQLISEAKEHHNDHCCRSLIVHQFIYNKQTFYVCQDFFTFVLIHSFANAEPITLKKQFAKEMGVTNWTLTMDSVFNFTLKFMKSVGF